MKRIYADLLLLLVSLIWGSAFIAQKIGNDVVGPLTFVGTRFLISALILIPFAIQENRRARQLKAPRLTAAKIVLASLVGLCLCVGAALQQIGLITTSATNGGFLTALYVVLVPFAVWGVSKEKPKKLVLAACVICISGAWLLSDHGGAQSFARGDWLIVISDIAWATGIALVPPFLKDHPRPFFLCFVQYILTAALAGGAGVALERPSLIQLAAGSPSLLYAGVVSGAIAYTLQIVAQRWTPAAEAALIMSLESVFAAIAGALVLHERLTPAGLGGCGLILIGVFMVEFGPQLIGRQRTG